MRRIRINPGQTNPYNNRRGRDVMTAEGADARRIDFPAAERPRSALSVDGLTPDRVQLGAAPEPADPSQPLRPRVARGPQTDFYDELYNAGVRATATAADLDFDDIETEFDEFDGLSEETYARLESAGIPRRIVDNYIAGALAMGERLEAEMHALVGGPERFEAMLDWAQTNLSPEELEAYDAAVTSSPEAARLAVRGLFAEFSRAAGDRPRLVGGALAGRAGGGFGSTQELVDAIKDPRYKKDPAYRADVERRLSRSNIFKR